MANSPLASLDAHMTAAVFAQLSDDTEATFTPAGRAVGVKVAAWVDFEAIELDSDNRVTEMRPVVTLPANLGSQVKRGATVKIAGTVYTVAQQLSDDGHCIRAVCDG